MMMVMPQMATANPLPPAPYRQQSKTRKRFSRATPETLKESLRRTRNREAAQDLRNRKKTYEIALDIKLREIATEMDQLGVEENLLLEEQARLQLELEATIGHPVALPSTEDSVMDSKTWATTGPRFIAASQQHSLQSPNFESETCTMGSSIEPADELPSCSLWCFDDATDVCHHGNGQLDGMPVDDLFPEYQVGATAVPHVECGRGGVGSSEDRSELLPSLELQLAPGDLSDLFCDWVTDSGEHQPMFTDEDEGRASPPLTLFFEHLDSEAALDDDFLAEILGGSC
eukprot:m.141811 g.141811  ORF g.141811 m.141811 type:complete len:287 (-) comp22883_c0_seq1:165-1025(-)